LSGFPIVTMLLRPACILPSFAIIAYSVTVGSFCVKIMDVGNTTASKALELYAPCKFYFNCTATLYNIDGIISSPVSGATFTWQDKDGTRTIVAAPADVRAEAEATTTASDSMSSNASDTAATSVSQISASTDNKPE
jgi:hypothetical protein